MIALYYIFKQMQKKNTPESSIKIRAVFQGQHGSMGYSKGSEYRLTVKKDWAYPNSGPGRPCPYTVEGFLANWKIIEILK